MGELIRQDVVRIVRRRMFIVGLLVTVAYQLLVLFSMVVPMGYGYDPNAQAVINGTSLPAVSLTVAALGNTTASWIVSPGACAAWFAGSLSSGYVDLRQSWGASRRRQTIAALLASELAAGILFLVTLAAVFAVSAMVSVDPLGPSSRETLELVRAGVLYDCPLDARYARDLVLPLVGMLLAVCSGFVLALMFGDEFVAGAAPAIFPALSSLDLRPLGETFTIGACVLTGEQWICAFAKTGAVLVLLVVAIVTLAPRVRWS